MALLNQYCPELRPQNEAYIHDFKDMFHPLAQAHAKKRLKCYQQLGCAIA